MAFPTISAFDSTSTPVTINTLPNAGQNAKAGSLGVALASDDDLVVAVGSKADASATSDTGTFSLIALFKRALGYWSTIATAASDTTTPSPVKIDQTTDGTTNMVRAVVRNPNYETVAASQAAQVLGTAGAAGDILSSVLIIPATTSPGAVSIQDGAGTAITIFTGGASSVTTLIPFSVPLGIVAGTNWKITTGANVSAIGIGKFS